MRLAVSNPTNMIKCFVWLPPFSSLHKFVHGYVTTGTGTGVLIMLAAAYRRPLVQGGRVLRALFRQRYCSDFYILRLHASCAPDASPLIGP